MNPENKDVQGFLLAMAKIEQTGFTATFHDQVGLVRWFDDAGYTFLPIVGTEHTLISESEAAELWFHQQSTP